ncbi:MAG: winged helix-turn-helix transcriptional regulator [Epulopiscium sp.]|nr:winged helix-turn-helix transcriptional regulator [Candidatus Epulonipiscium sp.]
MSKNLQAETCSTTIIHPDVIDKVNENMLDNDVLEDLAKFFKMFGHPTRVRILQALFIAEMCVCDISYALQMSQSAVSHQLRLLKDASLVKSRREGKSVYYSLDDTHISEIMNQGLLHVQE